MVTIVNYANVNHEGGGDANVGVVPPSGADDEEDDDYPGTSTFRFSEGSNLLFYAY